YLYYEGTMQARVLALMGRKLTAAQALEGTFSADGLVALAGEDANVEIALARSLVERLDEGDVRRLWGKVLQPNRYRQDELVPAGDGHVKDVLPLQRPRRRPGRAIGSSRRHWLFDDLAESG